MGGGVAIVPISLAKTPHTPEAPRAAQKASYLRKKGVKRLLQKKYYRGEGERARNEQQNERGQTTKIGRRPRGRITPKKIKKKNQPLDAKAAGRESPIGGGRGL